MKIHAIFALAVTLFTGAAQAGISFGAPDIHTAGAFPTAVALADLTGDGAPDLVAVHRASDDAWVWIGDGAGGFQFLQSFAVGNFPLGLTFADFDGNAALDLATTAVPFNSGTVTAWSGNGDGTFGASQTLTADDGTRSVDAVALDAGASLDLVVTNPTRGNISVFTGDGAGTFGAEIRTAMGSPSSYPTSAAIADFDKDGKLDVVTSNAQSSDASLGLVLGNGDGTFGAATAIPTTCTRPEYVLTRNFDGDENMDLAVACFASSEVAILLGDGNAGFAAPVLYDLLPDGPNPYWLLAEDFDNDGTVDLVTSGNGNFTVLRGRGDGTFDDPVSRESVGAFYGAATTDLNADGYPDLVLSNGSTDEIWVYLNLSSAAPLAVPAAGAAALGALTAAVLMLSGAMLRRAA